MPDYSNLRAAGHPAPVRSKRPGARFTRFFLIAFFLMLLGTGQDLNAQNTWGAARSAPVDAGHALSTADSSRVLAAATVRLPAPLAPALEEAPPTEMPEIPDALLEPPPKKKGILEVVREIATGTASYYGYALAGNPTANGEVFDPEELTAAHPSLPFGSRLRVTNMDNGKTVVVRVNDRGPFVGRRIIDLSRGAAKHLGMIRHGLATVKLELLRPD